MKNIKIPLLIKIYGFFIFIITLFNIIFLDFIYAFHGFGKYFGIFALITFLGILYSISIYKYIKKPSKLNGNFNIIILILLLFGDILYGLSIFKNLQIFIFTLIIPFTIKIFLINRFLKINKIIGNPQNFSEKNFYSEKPQEKGLLVTFGIIILFLIIFYFGYFIKGYDFKNIPDNYFDDNKLYKNVDSEKNGYKKFKDFLSGKKKIKTSYKNNEIFYEYKGKFFKIDTKKFYNNSGNLDKIDLTKDRIELIDKLRGNFGEISKKKYFIKPKNYNSTPLSDIINLEKETIHNIIYYLNNGDTKKGLDYLIEDYKIGKLFIGGYNDFAEKLIGQIIVENSQKNINYILDNYKLNKKNLLYLKENIINSKNIDGAHKKAIIYEYNLIKKQLSNINGNPFSLGEISSFGEEEKNTNIIDNFFTFNNFNFFNINSLIFFEKDYFKNMHKNIYYFLGKENIDKKLAFCNTKINFSKYNILKIMLLKKNGFLIIMGKMHCLSLNKIGNSKKFQKIKKQEKLILEKIDKQLKTTQQ